ncbi:unnamed protein product [Vicia faba]|uniref:Uncharacterized protein n=1 Tax=Vicia faba TaxID=3906 RepID=A0AAV1A7P1_VICFA|nr:unnamed protein product [Vicia faba]
MHQKKSEIQIGKESTGISSDFNPKLYNSIHHKHHHISSPIHHHHKIHNKIKPSKSLFFFNFPQLYSLSLAGLRRLRHRLRFVLLLSFPFFYFLLSRPTHSFFFNFLSAFAFSAALFFVLSLKFKSSQSLPIVLTVKRWNRWRHWRLWRRRWRWRDKKEERNKLTSTLVVFEVRVYSNGDVYEGEMKGGKCSGSGVYYYSMSGRYEGDWVDGKYDGFGVETWSKGSRYKGQYRDGFRHGFGVYRFYTGDVYAGEWLNGHSHGSGVHTCDDGSRFVGQFKWGVKHGLGHYHFRNGDTYAGEYFADKMHGFGVYCFANGHRYEGTWHEGKRHGLGMYTFRNGETQSGHWQNGVLDIPSTQNATYPVSPVGVNHSRVLNMVQEARRAVEKAYDVAKVDERVNRAVSAANRAANAARVAAIKAEKNEMHHINNESISIPIL